MKKIIFISWILFFAFLANAQVISLNGKWSFAIDPLNVGEQLGWQLPWVVANENTNLLPSGWDKVEVPHCWSLDVRYNFIGKAWYRKGFKLPADIANSSIRLNFDAVFYKCRIFLNGELIGFHEGGYTPFSLDITEKVKYPEVNFLAVEVDNSWDIFTIPGARTGKNPNDQLFPWYEFGGITRDVNLEISSKIYIANQKIEATPDLKSGTTNLKIITWVQNKSDRDTNIVLRPNIVCRTNQKVVVSGDQLSKQIRIKAWTLQKVIQETSLSAEYTLLWDFDNPNLYDCKTSLISAKQTISAYKTYFGIREFKAEGVQLLLNGNPVRLAGANRHSDHPKFGSTDPAELATQDMELQRNGNMIMARLNHTPTSRHFYQWADENGSLIIAEIPNWHIPPVLMANARLKELFRLQMTEMVQSFWNSPSIIAWSTGNEYSGWTPEGDEWTRCQAEKYRELDTTRLITYISHTPAADIKNLSVPHDSYRYCDFICINIYKDFPTFENAIKNVHQKYPYKPVFISECGLRADLVDSEQQRIEHLKGIIDIVRKNPYVTGFSYWSFNDYLSRFTNTNPSGYREWGIVDANRKPRGLYASFQTDLSPVIVTYEKSAMIISARADFPSYTLKNFRLVLSTGNKILKEYPLPVLNPGESIVIKMAKPSASTSIVVENAGGFKVYDSGVH